MSRACGQRAAVSTFASPLLPPSGHWFYSKHPQASPPAADCPDQVQALKPFRPWYRDLWPRQSPLVYKAYSPDGCVLAGTCQKGPLNRCPSQLWSLVEKTAFCRPFAESPVVRVMCDSEPRSLTAGELSLDQNKTQVSMRVQGNLPGTQTLPLLS